MSTAEITEQTSEDGPIVVIPAKKSKRERERIEMKPEADGPDDVVLPASGAESASGALEESEQTAKPAAPKISKNFREISNSEELEFKDWFSGLGLADGAFKIYVYRKDPRVWPDPKNGQSVKVEGLLGSLSQFLDEEEIRDRFGGGHLSIRVHHRNPTTGSWQYAKARDIHLAGDPRTDVIPRNVAPPAPAKPDAPTEASPSIVKETFGIMKEQIEYERNRPAAKSGPDYEMLSIVLKPLQMQIDSLQQSLMQKEQRIAELTDRSNKPAAEDPFKERMLEKFVADDGTRIQSVRIAYEAEIRAIKEGQQQQEDRVRDRAERDKQLMVESHNREISALKQMQDLLIASMKSSLDAQLESLKSEIRKLERENGDLRSDVKELRAKKEKSVTETAKELKEIREALGGDEEAADKSMADKIMEALPAMPAAIEAAKGMFGKGAQQQQPTQQQPQGKKKPEVVKDGDGNHFVVKGGKLIPVRKKEPPPVGPNGEVLPNVNPAAVTMATAYLERAFAASTEPAIVAQSARPQIPDEMLGAIQQIGLVEVLQKIGKVPMSSPLMTQAGKNWLRGVSKALVGEQ